MQDWTSCLQDVGKATGIPTIRCLEIVFSNILTMTVGLATLALFVMLLIGGFRYLTSSGDPKRTTAAKQTITYALVGLFLMTITFLIFKTIEFFTGVTVTKFEIPTP